MLQSDPLYRFHLTLADGVAAEALPGGRWRFQGKQHRITLGEPDDIFFGAFCGTLTMTGGTARSLATGAGGVEGRAEVYFVLEKLAQRDMLDYALNIEGTPWATLETWSPLERPVHRHADPVQLSRFVLLHREGTRMVIKHPLSEAYLVLHHPGAFMALGVLARPSRPELLTDVVPRLASEQAEALLWLFQLAGLTTPVRERVPEENRDPDLLHWEPLDLAFHVKSRIRRDGFGGTFPFAGRTAPLPPVRVPYRGRRVDLPVPDLDALRIAAPPPRRGLRNPPLDPGME